MGYPAARSQSNTCFCGDLINGARRVIRRSHKDVDLLFSNEILQLFSERKLHCQCRLISRFSLDMQINISTATGIVRARAKQADDAALTKIAPRTASDRINLERC